MNGADGAVVDVVAQSLSLHLSDRLVHKNWKVREAAYTCLTGKLASLVPVDEGEKVPSVVADFVGPLAKTYIKDANAAAHLSAMETAMRMISVLPSSMVAKLAPDVVKGLVEKAFSSRPGNKAKSVEVIAELVAADAAEPTVETLVAIGFSHKVPKIVVATVEALGQVIEQFGCIQASIPVKELALGLRKLLEHGNGDIRRVTKALLVEMARWVGGATAMKPLLKDVKEVVVRELEAAFAEHSDQPEPVRLTRKAEQLSREAQASDQPPREMAAVAAPISLAEAVDLLAKLNEFRIEIDDETTVGWLVAVDSKKWNVRKAAMDAVTEIAEGNTVKTGDMSEFVTKLRKVVSKDVNVNVTASAAKAISALSSGMGSSMHPAMARQLFVDLLTRLKEKNRVALEAVFNALDNMHSSGTIKLADVLQDITSSAAHKVPKARELTLVWLLACLQRSSGADIKPLFKDLCSLLVKCSEDTSGEVRDEALGGLARISFVMGPRLCSPFLERLDKVKQDKVTFLMSQSEATQGPPASKKPSGTLQAPQPTERKPAAPVSSQPPPQRRVEPQVKLSELVDDEKLSSLLTEMFEDVVLDGFLSKSFKQRSDEAEKMASQVLELKNVSVQHISVVFSCVSKGLGLRDSNPLSLNAKMRLVQTTAQQSATISISPLVEETVTGIAKKLGDIKSAIVAKETLLTFAESAGVSIVFNSVASLLVEEKNPRTISSMCSFLSTFISDFGSSAIEEADLVKVVSILLGNESPAVRKATVSLIGCFVLRTGRTESFISRVGASDDVTGKVNEDLAKRDPDDTKPTRTVRTNPLPSHSPRIPPHQSPTELNAPVVQNPQPADPGPTSSEQTKTPLRNRAQRISPSKIAVTPKARRGQDSARRQKQLQNEEGDGAPVQLPGQFDVDLAVGPEVISGLENKEWSTRHSYLKKIYEVLSRIKNELKVHVSDNLMRSVVGRTSDPNRNIVCTAYEVLTLIGRLLDDRVVHHLKLVVPVILSKGLLDNKKTVHSAALDALESWAAPAGIPSILCFIPGSLAIENSQLRRAVIEWTIKKMESDHFRAQNEDMLPFVVPTVSCLRDKVAEVRQLADKLLSFVVESVGVQPIAKVSRSLPEAQRLKIKPILDKHGLSSETPQRTRPSTTQTPTSRRSLVCRSSTPSVRVTPTRSESGSASSPPQSPPPQPSRHPESPMACVTPAARRLELDPAPCPSPMDIDHGRVEPPTPATNPIKRPNGDDCVMTEPVAHDFATKIQYFDDGSPEKESFEDFASRKASLSLAASDVPSTPPLSEVIPQASRTPSPQEKILVRDKVIMYLGSDDLETRLDGVRMLADGLQMAESKIHPRASEIVLSLVSLLSDAFQAIGVDERSERAIKYVLNGLMQMFQRVAIARGCDQRSIVVMFAQLFDCLTNDRVHLLKEGEQVSKALNHLTLKAVENSSQGILFTSLVQIADDLVRRPGPPLRKQMELSIKCLLRMTTGLRSLDPEEVLRDIHWFIDRNPGGLQPSEGSYSRDLAVRCMQQVALQLFEIYGMTLQNKMVLVPMQDPKPLVRCWVDTMIESQQKAAAAETASSRSERQKRSGDLGDGAVTGTDELRRVFSMIGQRATSQQGIQELHNFIRRNPSVSIEPYLRKTSAVFQRYIYQGLESIDSNAERQARLLHSSNGSSVHLKSPAPSAEKQHSSGDDYLRKLREIQHKFSGADSRNRSPTEKENRPRLE